MRPIVHHPTARKKRPGKYDRIFYTDHQIQQADGTRRDIRNIGITHNWFSALPKEKQELMRSLIPENSTLISEHAHKTFLPRELVGSAKRHQSEEINLDTLRSMIGVPHSVMLGLSLKPLVFFSEMRQHGLPIKVHAQTRKDLYMDSLNGLAGYKPFISKKYRPGDVASFMITGRSALMAADLLEPNKSQGDKPNNDIPSVVSVSGANHSYQINHFLKNPRLHYRTLRRLKTKLDNGRIPDKGLALMVPHRLKQLEKVYGKERLGIK